MFMHVRPHNIQQLCIHDTNWVGVESHLVLSGAGCDSNSCDGNGGRRSAVWVRETVPLQPSGRWADSWPAPEPHLPGHGVSSLPNELCPRRAALQPGVELYLRTYPLTQEQNSVTTVKLNVSETRKIHLRIMCTNFTVLWLQKCKL